MGLEFDFGQIRSNLMTIQKNVRKNVIDKSLDAGAEIMLEEQQNNVPVHTPDKKNRRAGGRLKASLGIGKKTGTDLKREVHVGIQNAQEREVVYGYYQEHGTSTMVGKKWMKRAWQKSIKKANEEIKKSLIKDITNL